MSTLSAAIDEFRFAIEEGYGLRVAILNFLDTIRYAPLKHWEKR